MAISVLVSQAQLPPRPDGEHAGHCADWYCYGRVGLAAGLRECQVQPVGAHEHLDTLGSNPCQLVIQLKHCPLDLNITTSSIINADNI